MLPLTFAITLSYGLLMILLTGMAGAESNPEKIQNIKKLLLVSGIQEQLSYMKNGVMNSYSQMIGSAYPEVPDAFWAEFNALIGDREMALLIELQTAYAANARVISDWAANAPWVDFLASVPETRSNTSLCLKITDPAVTALPHEAQWAFVRQLTALLEDEGVAFDIATHRDAPPGLRIWAGATVETSDLEALTPWLDWAFARAKSAIAEAA